MKTGNIHWSFGNYYISYSLRICWRCSIKTQWNQSNWIVYSMIDGKKEIQTQEIEILTEISEIWACNKINMTGYIAILPYLTQSIITFMFSADFCCMLETAGGEKIHTQKVKQSFCRYNSVLHLPGYHADTPITIKAEAIHEADSRIH